MEEDLRREIIMDNYLNPYHKEYIDKDDYIKTNTRNASCIDNLDIQIKIENNVIKEIYFTGEACAISTSSTSIMNRLLEEKNIEEALEIINNFQNMINEKEYKSEILDDANVFDEIYKQENRKTCALLPWNGVKQILINLSVKD